MCFLFYFVYCIEFWGFVVNLPPVPGQIILLKSSAAVCHTPASRIDLTLERDQQIQGSLFLNLSPFCPVPPLATWQRLHVPGVTSCLSSGSEFYRIRLTSVQANAVPYRSVFDCPDACRAVRRALKADCVLRSFVCMCLVRLLYDFRKFSLNLKNVLLFLSVSIVSNIVWMRQFTIHAACSTYLPLFLVFR
jgi:hypothetical protein